MMQVACLLPCLGETTSHETSRESTTWLLPIEGDESDTMRASVGECMRELTLTLWHGDESPQRCSTVWNDVGVEDGVVPTSWSTRDGTGTRAQEAEQGTHWSPGGLRWLGVRSSAGVGCRRRASHLGGAQRDVTRHGEAQTGGSASDQEERPGVEQTIVGQQIEVCRATGSAGRMRRWGGVASSGAAVP